MRQHGVEDVNRGQRVSDHVYETTKPKLMNLGLRAKILLALSLVGQRLFWLCRWWDSGFSR